MTNPASIRGFNIASVGIINPKPRTLCPQTKVYRFASSTQPEVRWPLGPWWCGKNVFNTIVHQAIHPASTTPGMTGSARNALAIKKEWGSMVDILLEGIINRHTEVLCGPGKAMDETTADGVKLHWEGGYTQYFIPVLCYDLKDIYNPGMAPMIYRKIKITPGGGVPV